MAQQLTMAQQLAATRHRLRGLVAAVVDRAGLDLEDLIVSRAGRRTVVRVVVDCDGGVSHQELSEVAHDISVRLDQAEAAGDQISADAYTLEVSSPGVDRPLTEPHHWRRNIGRLVTVRLDNRVTTARIVDVSERGITLSNGERYENVPFARLGPGRVQVEFHRPDEPAAGFDHGPPHDLEDEP